MVARRQDEPTQIQGVRVREESGVQRYRTGRVCEDLLIPHHTGVEHHFPHRLARSAERLSLKIGAIR